MFIRNRTLRITPIAAVLTLASVLFIDGSAAQQAEKPVLHGRHWVAITGKPLGATAGAKIFDRGGKQPAQLNLF